MSLFAMLPLLALPLCYSILCVNKCVEKKKPHSTTLRSKSKYDRHSSTFGHPFTPRSYTALAASYPLLRSSRSANRLQWRALFRLVGYSNTKKHQGSVGGGHTDVGKTSRNLS